MRRGFAMLVVWLLPSVVQANDWLTEEVLKRLDEIQIEVKSLRKELAETRKDMDAIRHAAGEGNMKTGHAEFGIDGEPNLGAPTANIAIVEFTDFECPYCARHETQTLPKLMSEYVATDKVRYITKDFPLDFHRRAKSASLAANCADAQGQYSAMRQTLFSNPRELTEAFYLKTAESLSLNMETFRACLNNPAGLKEIDTDLQEGVRAGVRGTPAFFIGKLQGNRVTEAVALSGAVPFEQFKTAIDRLLAQP